MSLPPPSHLREFLLDASSLVTALTTLLVAVAPCLKAIKNVRKEWKSMQPKTRLEGVKSVVQKKSVLLPLVLAVLFTGMGSSILVGRAAVSDTGKAIGNVTSFSVDDNYSPSGKMGDIGDVSVDEQPGLVRFVYEAQGRGPHLWEWTYDSEGNANLEPAQSAGVMYLDTRGNWGTDPDGGFDLRGCHGVIKWEARSADGPVRVKFLLGGDKRNLPTKDRAKFPYPNTIDQALRTEDLSDQWREFTFNLSKVPEERFKRVVGGFGWEIAWSSNGIKLNSKRTAAENPKTFTIEIRNVRYEKEEMKKQAP
jgi:hypothetical protein